MSVLLETSVGDIIVDLETEACPQTSLCFLKLCKTYYYNFNSFFNVQRDFIAQTGDPSDKGTGGESIFPSKFFAPEYRLPQLRHNAFGTLSMAVAGGKCGSQFFFTLSANIDYLDGKHVPFGRIVGEDSVETLNKINEALVDDNNRPLRDIRLRHVIVLDDPFPDPPGLVVPPNSPVPTAAQLKSLRVGDEEELEDPNEDETAKEKRRREQEARSQALTLEMVGDLPFADVAPPENVLFVCKLNAVTRSEDLELIFSRFGTILSCEVIRDKKTGDSLNYAFIEFDKREDAERAYFKMDNVLIDDRRIHVDFSNSVTKLHGQWVFQRTGGRAPPNKHASGPNPKRRRSPSLERSRDDLVFDLKDRDASRRDYRRRSRSRSPKRRDGDRRRSGRDDRDYDRRRDDRDRGHGSRRR